MTTRRGFLARVAAALAAVCGLPKLLRADDRFAQLFPESHCATFDGISRATNPRWNVTGPVPPWTEMDIQALADKVRGHGGGSGDWYYFADGDA